MWSAEMRGPTWTNESLLDLEDLLAAGATDQAVARRLGRTVTAVRVARKRYGVPCRRRLIMTQRGVARLMGVGCGKTVSRWIEEGWLRSRPGASLGNGRERYVTRDPHSPIVSTASDTLPEAKSRPWCSPRHCAQAIWSR